MSKQNGWYFTAPWEPVPVRRGDALGFRAGADHFAELLAPGLSNGTSDARWITLLSWCLQWSHEAWRNAGGGDLSGRDEQRSRYAWLRPLELLWIARTREAEQKTGQLRGRRSVDRWIYNQMRLANFAMSPDQFRRYRQIGTYGAYRVVFRTTPSLTVGNDGWTPGPTAVALANLVNRSLPRDARLKDSLLENGTKWEHWIGDEARYWVERGWQHGWARLGGLLPTPDHAAREPLPEEERCLLEHALFPDQSVLRVTAMVLAKARGANSHADLCDALADSNALGKLLGHTALAPLPSFSRFADAAMHAMRGLWQELNSHDEKQAPSIAELARASDLKSRLDQLREAGDGWLHASGKEHFQPGYVATRLAEAMRGATTPAKQLVALARHHQEHGGGRRWFNERSGKLIPLVADTGVAESDYRFRLRSLCLMAAQCGVAKMDRALDAIAQQESDDEEEAIE